MNFEVSKSSSKDVSKKLSVVLVLIIIIDLLLLIRWLLSGNTVALLSPKGPIAQDQMRLMITTASVMLAIAIPTLALFYYFAWKYRETNGHKTYEPDAQHSKYLIAGLWALPIMIILTLTSIMWPATHRLEPQKAIASDVEPLTIQVVALRWKWLFIYPEQNIATVNTLQIPTNTPIRFELTADEAPMSSFWIPQLGGQLYAMTGHANPLYLMADTPGIYNGSSAEINGPGFSGMKFSAQATLKEDFDRWVDTVASSPDVLDSNEYNQLLIPSENSPATYFASIENDMFQKVIAKYHGTHDVHIENIEHGHSSLTEQE